MKKASLFFFGIFIVVISSVSFAETSRIIYVNQNGNDNYSGSFYQPVETLATTIQISKLLIPSKEDPVLIHSGRHRRIQLAG